MSLSFETFPTFALRLRPGRRRMLDGLLAAGAAGLSMTALASLYYDDEPMPPCGAGSVNTQIQRLRSQVSREGWSLNGVGSRRRGGGGMLAGVFVLASAEVPPEPEAEIVEPVRAPVHRAFGIVATPGFRGVSVARSAFLEGAAG